MLAALREKEGTVSVSEKAIGVFSLRAEEPHLTRNDVTGHFFVLVGSHDVIGCCFVLVGNRHLRWHVAEEEHIGSLNTCFWTVNRSPLAFGWKSAQRGYALRSSGG